MGIVKLLSIAAVWAFFIPMAIFVILIAEGPFKLVALMLAASGLAITSDILKGRCS